ncbi:hypothetical protein QC762_0031140 [Podospora pseudocomata]|uniref:Uncharacterized protein n=1 Tax=Podospora pseudocomata TaxID=2093779 RepID=A0ABR0GQ23_9PEZI|nr:hypothetical protein QC762_0031140 [Podospora pseudocomata]
MKFTSNAKEASGKGNKNKLETVGPLARRYGSNMQEEGCPCSTMPVLSHSRHGNTPDASC